MSAATGSRTVPCQFDTQHAQRETFVCWCGQEGCAPCLTAHLAVACSGIPETPGERPERHRRRQKRR